MVMIQSELNKLMRKFLMIGNKCLPNLLRYILRTEVKRFIA